MIGGSRAGAIIPGRGRRAQFVCLSVLCVLVSPVPAQVPPQPPGVDAPRARRGPVTDAQIQTAINRAVSYLKGQVSSRARAIDGGYLSVVTMALLKAEVSRDSPEMSEVIPRIAARVSGGKFIASNHHIYDAGVTLMALAS